MGDIVPNAININGWDFKKKIIYGIVAEIKSWKKKKNKNKKRSKFVRGKGGTASGSSLSKNWSKAYI